MCLTNPEMLGDWTTTVGFDRFTGLSGTCAGSSAGPSWAFARAFDPETAATVREALLLPCDLAPIVPDTGPGQDVIVLLHGFMATAGVFRPMRARLEREGDLRVASFTHPPGFGVRRIASQLEELMDRIHPEARVHLVGHSLGGVVARWYVQELGGHRRVTQTISLASPFQGARFARRLPLFVGADLHGESRILARIRARAHRGGVRHTSVVGGADRLVFPPESACFPSGEVVHLAGRGHNMLLFDDEVARLIIRLVRGVAPRSAVTP
jgi:triacylglycerol lipase